MELFIVSLVSVAVGIVAGGFLGYRYGKSAQVMAQKVVADVKEVKIP